MMIKKNYSWQDFQSRLFMSDSELKSIFLSGHEIGLHSHTHPTNINAMPIAVQKHEYKANFDFIYSLLGLKPRSISYPCGLTNSTITEYLSSLGIQVGFMAVPEPASNDKLMIPRTNHVSLLCKVFINKRGKLRHSWFALSCIIMVFWLSLYSNHQTSTEMYDKIIFMQRYFA